MVLCQLVSDVTLGYKAAARYGITVLERSNVGIKIK